MSNSKILYGKKRALLPDGRVERSGTDGGVSRATGTKFEKPKGKPTRVNKARSTNITPLDIDTEIDNLFVHMKLNRQFIEIIQKKDTEEDEEETAGDENSIADLNFDFLTIGSAASKSTTGSIKGGVNTIRELSNSQQNDLQAIANYLIANPQATVRFQYKSPIATSHPAFNNDLRTLYNMSFRQITNFFRQRGVQNLNRRVTMSLGSGFQIFIKN